MCLESKAREPKRYLSSRPDKAIDYTVRKYCTYSIGLHYEVEPASGLKVYPSGGYTQPVRLPPFSDEEAASF